MRKAVITIVLILCLFAGLTIADTAGQRERSVFAPPPEATAPASPSDSTASPLPSSLPSPSSEASPPPSASAAAVPPPVTLPEQLDRLFSDMKEFSGSVLIERDNRVILCRSYGVADAETGVRNTPETKFLVGSVTSSLQPWRSCSFTKGASRY